MSASLKLQPISYGVSGIEFIIETLFSSPLHQHSHMAGRSTGLIVRLFTPPIWRVEHGGLIRKEKNQVLFFFSKKREPICPLIAQSTKSVASNKHDPICAISVQRVPPISLTPSTTHSLPCRFSQSIQYVSLNSRANTTRFVPCLLSQNPPPHTSAIRSVPCRLSQSGLCDCLVQSKSST